MFFIGSLRRFLFIPWESRWNACVRDITAWFEVNVPRFIRSKINKNSSLILCPDCGVEPRKPHENECDVERCSICGEQRLTCGHTGNQRMLENWMGIYPK